MKRKILISPGYGSGWSSWMRSNREQAEYALTYEPLICAIESKDQGSIQRAIDLFKHDFRRNFDDEPYIGNNVYTLEVVEVEGQFIIDEYDGSESVMTPDSFNWYNTDELKPYQP